MPEGLDAIMEAGDTYEQVVGEIKTALHAISSAQRLAQ